MDASTKSRAAAGFVPAVVMTVLLVGVLTLASQVEAQVTARDSLGVAIVATDGLVARAPSQIRVQGQPEVQIGVIDGDPAYMFSRIMSVALLTGGRVFVVDGASSTLRFFDSGGRLLVQTGGSGQGPGEFQLPYLVNTAGDSLAIQDVNSRRVTLLSNDGGGFRTFQTGPLGGRVAAASPPSAAQLVVVGVANSVPTLPPGRPPAGPMVLPRRVGLVDLATDTDSTLAETPYTNVRVMTPGVTVASVVVAPYFMSPAVAVSRAGFLVTAVTQPALLEYDWTGRLRRVLRLSEPPNRVTEAEFAAAIEPIVNFYAEQRGVTPAVVRTSFDGLEPPDVEPTFQAIVVDDMNWVWAQLYDVSNAFVPLAGNDATHWLVFDEAGRGRGSVSMPSGLDVESIRGNLVAGVWRDAFGVEYVRVHRIEGRP